MSAETKKKAQQAKEFLEGAEDRDKVAKKYLEQIGDTDGAKMAGEAADANKRAREYIEKRLG